RSRCRMCTWGENRATGPPSRDEVSGRTSFHDTTGYARPHHRHSEGAAMATPTATSGLAPVNGIELGYQVFGKGDPLILLHGGFGSVEMFGPNVDLLAAGQRVIGVDLQSHGRTPVANRPMRFETMADDVAALIRELGLPRSAVM